MDSANETMRERTLALKRVFQMRRHIQDHPTKIEDGLYVGSIQTAKNKEELKRLNITHILTVANYMIPLYPNEFVYKIINVPDKQDADIKQYFDDCINFIDEAKRTGGGVLVHCVVGKSRSVTIVVAYLMKKQGMSKSEALQHVRSKRPIASPNPGFRVQLKDFEKSLHEHEKEKTTLKCMEEA